MKLNILLRKFYRLMNLLRKITNIEISYKGKIFFVNMIACAKRFGRNVD